jgi:NAD(P)-dependent dehydrogenase (short-subunit alcohol dehydrogenase family)
MELKEKVILVTGSSSGIGKETAKLLAREGAKVAITYHKNKKEGEEALQEIKKEGTCALVQLDVTDDASIQNCISTILTRFEKLDGLVNNAGVIRWKELSKQDFEDIHIQVRTNLEGAIKVVSACLPHIKMQNEAVITNIASGAAKTPYMTLSTYCATKFGLRGFTQALALELPKNVRIYCVNPGMTKTQMTNFHGEPPENAAKVVVNAMKENLGKKSGEDVDAWEYR